MPYAYSVEKMKNVANVSTDRILMLQPSDTPRRVTGMVDKRLFTGDNKLHAIQDAGLWFLRYEQGALPRPLQQRWTNFNQLMKFTTTYFNSRNVDVKEVIS